ncbi:unnamed protein product, partial [Symbiodinium sp. KB8]
YLLTAVYTVPVDVNGRPLLSEEQTPQNPDEEHASQVALPCDQHEPVEGDEDASCDNQLGEWEETLPGTAQGGSFDQLGPCGDKLACSGEDSHEPQSEADAGGPCEPREGEEEDDKPMSLVAEERLSKDQAVRPRELFDGDESLRVFEVGDNALGEGGSEDDDEPLGVVTKGSQSKEQAVRPHELDTDEYEPSEPPDPDVLDCDLAAWFGDERCAKDESPPAGRELLARCAEDEAQLEADAGSIKMVELVFVEALDTKAPTEVAHAAARIMAKLQALKLPVVKVHTDSGSEFVSAPFRRFVDARGILHTVAAPQEHNSNGRVENVVRRLKQQVRVLLLAQGHPAAFWACAARAVAAMWCNHTLCGLGWKQPAVVPYGAKTQILTRTWHRRRQADWMPRAEDALVLCPASLVKHGYVLLVGEQLKLATKLFCGADPELEVVVKAPPEEPAAFEEVVPPAPERRIRSKRPVLAKVGPRSRFCNQAVDHAAHELAMSLPFDREAALDFVVDLSLSQLGASQKCGRRVEGGSHHVFGQFVHGGITGITNNTRSCPGLTQLLTCIVHDAVPNAVFTSLVLSVDATAKLHRDVYNHKSWPNHVIPLCAPSSGGGLWVQGEGSEVRTLPNGQSVPGGVLSLESPLELDASKWHSTEPWPQGEHRVALVAYVVGRCDKLGKESREEPRGEDEADGPGRECEQVLLPDSDFGQGLVASERETFLGTFEERGLHEACESTNLADLLVQREAVEAELRAISLREEGTVQVSAVTEVSSEAALDGSPEQVLQTKIVPNWQVLQHFEAWRPAIVAEYLSLTEEKQALDPVTQETLDELTKAGAKVDWGFTRDAELRTLRVPWKGQLVKLVQSLADECVWYAVPEGVELVQDPDVPLGPYTEGRETVRADSPKDHEESGMRLSYWQRLPGAQTQQRPLCGLSEREGPENRLLDLSMLMMLLSLDREKHLRIGWPLPDQPTMREIRYHRSEWGGDQSALFQAPPTVVREDFYQYDIDRPAVLVRWHAVTRRHRFTPAGTRLPIPIVPLTGRRRTLAIYQSGGSRAIDDNWRNPAVARVADAHFRGRTELEVNVQILAMQEAMRDNVPPEVD